MRVTDLIEQLQAILSAHGDLRIGSSAASPDEGYAYPIAEAYLIEDDENMSYVDILVDTEDEPLNE